VQLAVLPVKSHVLEHRRRYGRRAGEAQRLIEGEALTHGDGVVGDVSQQDVVKSPRQLIAPDLADQAAVRQVNAGVLFLRPEDIGGGEQARVVDGILPGAVSTSDAMRV